MIRFASLTVTKLILVTLLVTVEARAADEIVNLSLGEARLLPLLEAPARIYLDDPSIAELSTPEPGQVMVAPRATGKTVLHALTDDGTPIATIEIDVAATAAAPRDKAARPIELTLQPGQALKLPLLAPAERIFVNDPTVVSVGLGAEPDQIAINGLAPGTTTVFALSAEGTRVGLYRLTVASAGAPTPPPGNGKHSAPTNAPRYPVTLALPEATLVDLPQPAASIVIDDPTIVGAQINTSSKLAVFSKAMGTTTIRALDTSRQPIAIIQVTVSGTAPPEP